MGKSKPLNIISKVICLFSTKIPFSYYGLILKEFGDSQKILDVGCGDGTLMYILNHSHRYQVQGVDIFKEYVKKARKLGVYKKVINMDIKKLDFVPKSFDIVFCNHVVEHLLKNEGHNLVDKMENIAKKKVIVVAPFGFLEQSARDGNVHQKHLSAWYPSDFIKRGYKVIGQGLNIYTRNKLINRFCSSIGPLNNIFFLFHVLFQPFLATRYKYCHQLICVKEIDE